MKNAILAISEKKEILKQIRKELAEKYEVITFNNLLDAIDMVRESDFDYNTSIISEEYKVMMLHILANKQSFITMEPHWLIGAISFDILRSIRLKE